MSDTSPTDIPAALESSADSDPAASDGTAIEAQARDELFELNRPAHPLATRIWSLTRDRSEVDRKVILDALRRRLRHGRQTANQGIAIEALIRFDEARQGELARAQVAGAEPEDWATGPLTHGRYAAFRKSRPDATSWPSAGLISNAFDGGWPNALSTSGLGVAPDVLVRRRVMRAGPFTDDEVFDLLKIWLAENPEESSDSAAKFGAADHSGAPRLNPDQIEPLSEGSFVVWLERRGNDPAFAGTRHPSRPTLTKVYGSWDNALRTVGALERHPVVASARRAAAEGGAKWEWALGAVCGLDWDTAPTPEPRPPDAGFSAEYLIACLRWLTSGVEARRRRRLTVTDWTMLRRAATYAAYRQGRFFDMPGYTAMARKGPLGSWPRARFLAGFTDSEVGCRQGSGEPFSNVELLNAFDRCAHKLGHIPIRLEYERWRLSELEGADAAGRRDGGRFPSEATLRVRLPRRRQCWDEVIQVALERRPSLRQFPASAEEEVK